MSNRDFISALGFLPKENSQGVFSKKYAMCEGYMLEVDLDNETFNFGTKISADSKTTHNFTQAENWVVLECVNRLLCKGYQPQNIILEKTWKTGHGTSGRLDILVTNDDGSAYLMIECKTWGTEFDKEIKSLEKNGGQLFTYFQQDKSTEVLVLYASALEGGKIKYRNEIIKIEDDYRQTANVKDFYDRWNKLPKQNGVFDKWCTPYNFESKALTTKDLIEIQQEDSSFIFNQFLEILRHNVVSDKPNAFNKIFTLFLCKIYDEKYTGPNDELAFQWFYGAFTYDGIRYEKDTHIIFQKRLTDLYKRGMNAFLEKDVTDISDAEFDKKYSHLEEADREALKDAFTEIRLKKNNEFAIKEVFNDESFEENAKVVKEVVELLQGYKIRYTKKQQYLSDFFELLLTTGLKQESGQFFTPVPIAQFVIKSLPLDMIVKEKLASGKADEDNLLPYIIDNASGSGHFITESMHEVQSVLNTVNPADYAAGTEKKIKNWQTDHFDWAFNYVYGVEKDYRLVKVGKVGCYLHGDGLARIIHSDGLASFKYSDDYKGKLKETNKEFKQDNGQFDILVSNPPYSVSSFRNNARKYYTEEDFGLYEKLTDNSSEIECLFIERTKQLLKEGGVAGIILPSSILSNTGIYTKTRELILLNFDIVGVTELGSNTFMATGTNTVVLFLRRRDNYFASSLKNSVQKALADAKDITLHGIENPIAKYVSHVWDTITPEDYKTLLGKEPNKAIEGHEIYQEYKKKIKAKDDNAFWKQTLKLEQDKLLHFVIAYPQRVVLVKTGEKNAEKLFLGYEFSNRRGSEGIHAIQRSKSIDECTQLFDAESFTNPEKASTYIYKAFEGEYDIELPDSLKSNICYANLVDMLTFDRVDFEKNISLSAKKKVKIESKWEQARLDSITTLIKRGKSPKYGDSKTQIIKSGQARGFYSFDFSKQHFVSDDFILDERKLEKGDLLLNSSGVGTAGRVTAFYLDGDFVVDSHISILRFETKKILPRYALNIFGFIGFKTLESLALGQSGQIEMTIETISNIKIPLPPINIQQKIVEEIEVLEKQEERDKEGIDLLKSEISKIISLYPKSKIASYCNISRERENPQLSPKKKFINIGLEHIESNTGKITVNEEFGEQILSTKSVFIEGDLLYGKLRPYLNKVADPSFSGICSTDILVLKTSIPKLLKYALSSSDFVEQTSALMSGASLPRIKPKEFLELEIPLPPLAEQQKIVAQIEKIEAKIVKLEEQVASVPKQKEAILKKYL